MQERDKVKSSNKDYKKFKYALIIISLIFFGYPLFYSVYKAKPDELHGVSGKVSLSNPQKGKGYDQGAKYLIIKKKSHSVKFICKPSLFSNYKSCYDDAMLISLNGTEAKAIWYNRKMLPFVSRKQLVSIELNNGSKYLVSDEIHKTSFFSMMFYYILFAPLIFMITTTRCAKAHPINKFFK